MRMVWGSAVAYWLSGIIDPAFVAIAVMIALFIPISISEYFYYHPSYRQSDMDHQPDQSNHAAQKTIPPSSRRLLEEDE